jgi:hypothetical protein
MFEEVIEFEGVKQARFQKIAQIPEPLSNV